MKEVVVVVQTPVLGPHFCHGWNVQEVVLNVPFFHCVYLLLSCHVVVMFKFVE